MENEDSIVGCQKPSPQHWMNHAIGRSGFYLASIFSSLDSETKETGGEIRVELVIGHEDAKRFFPALERQKSAIEAELGFPLVWYNPAEKKMAKMYVRKPVNVEDREEWPAYFTWLKQHLEKMHKVLAPRVRTLVPDAPEPAPMAALS